MNDPFGTVVSWILIFAAAAYVVYHWARTIRSWRLESRSAAAIMFGTGVLVITLPGKVYHDLPAEAFDILSWIGLIMIVASFAIETLGRRNKHGTASSGEPLD